MFSMERLLVLGSMVLFAMLVLSFTRSSLSHSESTLNNEALVTGVALSQSMIEEIQSRAFDENTITAAVTTTSGLTSAASLGTESGETTSTNFDDVDDFNSYSRTESLERLGNFYISVDVCYVNYSNPTVKVTSKTFNKRIDVNIYNLYLPDTLSIYKIISY